jgi:hypothetical protein
MSGIYCPGHELNYARHCERLERMYIKIGIAVEAIPGQVVSWSRPHVRAFGWLRAPFKPIQRVSEATWDPCPRLRIRRRGPRR